MLSRVIHIATHFLYRAKYFLSRVREKIAAKKPSHSKKNFNNRVVDNSYMYMELKNKNNELYLYTIKPLIDLKKQCNHL